MKYNIGQKLFVERNGKLKTIEIEDICYDLGNGRINNKKYITEWELDEAIDSGSVLLTSEIYKQKKIAEKKEQLKKLQEELKIMEAEVK